MSRFNKHSLSPNYERISACSRIPPTYLDCNCEKVTSIKRNLILAAETISMLKLENQTIRDSVKKEYEEKINYLDNECQFLKGQLSLLSNLQEKKVALKQQIKSLTKNIIKKDKIIYSQEEKLQEISSSIKEQVNNTKSLINYNNILRNQLDHYIFKEKHNQTTEKTEKIHKKIQTEYKNRVLNKPNLVQTETSSVIIPIAKEKSYINPLESDSLKKGPRLKCNELADDC